MWSVVREIKHDYSRSKLDHLCQRMDYLIKAIETMSLPFGIKENIYSLMLFFALMHSHALMHFFGEKVSVAQSCLTLCDPVDCRILQARILEWVTKPSSR